MPISALFTKGYSNGSFTGSVPLITLRGFTGGKPALISAIPNISVPINTGTHVYDMGSYYDMATSYAINPTLESGFGTFNKSTGELRIATGIARAIKSYIITGTNGAGSVDSNSFSIEVTGSATTGGFWFDYDKEYNRRKLARVRLEEEKEKALKISDALERKISLEFKKKEEEEIRSIELDMLTKLASDHQVEIERSFSARVNHAVKRAILQSNYSAMEALERELNVVREEELFLIEATLILVNQ